MTRPSSIEQQRFIGEKRARVPTEASEIARATTAPLRDYIILS